MDEKKEIEVKHDITVSTEPPTGAGNQLLQHFKAVHNDAYWRGIELDDRDDMTKLYSYLALNKAQHYILEFRMSDIILCMFEIDHMKKLNEEGYEKVNSKLKRMAGLMTAYCEHEKSNDFDINPYRVAEFGKGDLFAYLIQCPTLTSAQERVIQHLQDLATQFRFSFSIGIARPHWERYDETYETWKNRAIAFLNAAKHAPNKQGNSYMSELDRTAVAVLNEKKEARGDEDVILMETKMYYRAFRMDNQIKRNIKIGTREEFVAELEAIVGAEADKRASYTVAIIDGDDIKKRKMETSKEAIGELMVVIMNSTCTFLEMIQTIESGTVKQNDNKKNTICIIRWRRASICYSRV